VDDFEAMRQTYKRNQHGTHNPVLLGQMFQRMMSERKLSQRQLAEQVEVSEGTIRNALEYVRAAEVRNDYAFDELSVKQVRAFRRLTPVVGNLWLDCGADLSVFGQTGIERDYGGVDEPKSFAYSMGLGWLEDCGLVGLLPERPKRDFAGVIKRLGNWWRWERQWTSGGLKGANVRPFTEILFRFNWRTDSFYHCDRALSAMCNIEVPEFVLSPDEFKDAWDAAVKNRDDVGATVALKVAELGRTVPPSKAYGTAADKLRQIEVEREAPDYIKASQLPFEQKWELWKLDTQAAAHLWFPDKRLGGAITHEELELAKRQIAGGRAISVPKGKYLRVSCRPLGLPFFLKADVRAVLEARMVRHQDGEEDSVTLFVWERGVATTIP